MRSAYAMVAAAAVSLAACGGMEQQQAIGEPRAQAQGAATGELALETRTASSVSGTWTRDGQTVRFSAREVEPGVYDLEVSLRGLMLTGLTEPGQGVGDLDGYAAASGRDTQLVDEDRELLGALYGALNAAWGSEPGEPGTYLRRAVGLWAQHPGTVELARTVMGEEGRGYTMLCSYAKCGGYYTGSCSSYNWYYYAKHDCQHGGFDYTGNQQIAQLGDHYSCSGDEWYYTSSGWVCGEPDHWSRPKVVGNCFGRCGGGCGGDTQYTLDATNHDGCVRNGHALASAYCDDQFTSASDDEMFAPNCY